MKNKKLILLIAFCVVLLGLGVSQMHFGFDEKDAEIFADDFMKIATGCNLDTIDTSKYWDVDSLENLKETFDKTSDEVVNKLFEENSDYKATEEDKKQFKEILMKVMSKAKYSIGKATRTEDGFEVPITIEPIKVFSGVYDGYSAVTIEYINEKGVDNIDYEDLAKVLFQEKLSNIDKNLDEPEYVAPIEKIMHIQKGEKYYYGSEEDAKKIGEVLMSDEMDIPEMTSESMKERTEKLLNSAETGEMDSSLDPMDIISAAVYHDAVKDAIDEVIADESTDRIKYLDEEGIQDYRTFLELVLEMVKYEVVDAEKTGEGYEVTVRKSSPDSDSFINKVDEEVVDYLESQNLDNDITEEAFLKIAYREEIDRLLTGVKSIEYKEPEIYTVKFVKRDDATYEVEQDSLIELLNA